METGKEEKAMRIINIRGVYNALLRLEIEMEKAEETQTK
jgi:hypothetical protein